MASSTDAGVLGTAAGATTAGARTVRNSDDRLTLLAVRMTYVALSFFFASFYFGLVYLQLINENGLWLPKVVHQPNVAFGAVEVGLILVAGLVYFWGQWAGLYARNFGRLHLALWVAAILTLVSLIMHIIELHAPGFGLQDGGYVSVFIAIEGVFTGLLILVALTLFGVANRARLGRFRQSGVAIEAFGEFYGWIAGIALINFLALYIQPFLPIG